MTVRLVLDRICKEFPTPGEPLKVLEDVSLSLAAGESCAVVGPSGSGKSTLLNVVGTLEPPTSGTVTLEGVNPAKLDEPSLARFRAEHIGFVFQDHHLLPECTALENVLIPTVAFGRTESADVERAEALLERVGLAERRAHRPSELSGGQRQRVALARSLIRRPTVLLADEPTGNLDHKTALEVAELLCQLQRQEGTILLVATHNPDLVPLLDRSLAIGN